MRSIEADAASVVRDAGGPELLERLRHLDAAREAPRPDGVVEGPSVPPACDVVFAGGGLSILVAAALAKRGARVIVVDRARAGTAHREWNASEAELRPLTDRGLLDTLDEVRVATYDEGFCQFHGGSPYGVRGVLDVAVDAGALLARVRRRAEAWGVRFVDGHALEAWGASAGGVRALFSGDVEISARILVDARGAASPLAVADLLCPTVGGVLEGAPFDPKVGEILVTTEGISEGVQHVWEAFPGRDGQLTTYLFYYADAAKVRGRPLLMPLYARFFRELHRYKPGAVRLVRPTFGYIPGWSRTVPGPRAPAARVVLSGDVAARHSPLTFCGFGSMLRSFGPAADALYRALEQGRAPDPHLMQDAPIHRWTGALAKLMASGRFQGNAMNELLDAAFSTLHGMGNDDYAACLKDTMSAPRFYRFVRDTARKRPEVFGDVLRGLGPSASVRWAGSVLSEAVRGL